MNREIKDVLFKLSVKIDHTNDRIDELTKVVETTKAEVQGLLVEISKLIRMFQGFERIIHKGVKH